MTAAADKPRYTGTRGDSGWTPCWECKRSHDDHVGDTLACPPTTSDKPSADLVALFDAFARLPEGHASLSLFGSEHEPAFRGWAAQHGHRIEETPLHNQTEGRWTSLEVTLAGGWITVHLDSVEGSKEQPEAAEGSV